MNTNIFDRLTANGTPLFKYERPTFNGFGFVEEPDERVVDVIEELVAHLANGYREPSNSGLADLKTRRADLEDEAKNGYDQTFSAWQDAGKEFADSEVDLQTLTNRLDQLKAITIVPFDEQLLTSSNAKLTTARDHFTRINESTAREIAKLKPQFDRKTTELQEVVRQINEWTQKPDSEEKTKDLRALNGEKADLDKQLGGLSQKLEEADKKILQAQAALDSAKSESDVLKEQKAKYIQDKNQADETIKNATSEVDAAEILNIGKRAKENQARLEHEKTKYLIASELREVLQKIEDTENKMDRNYHDLFSLENLITDAANKGDSFQKKIGSDSFLNKLFLLVSGKIENSRLSYNANLLLKRDLIAEFIFLRIFYNEGLRDENAIFSRIIDEKDGGMKYLYNYIIERVVVKIIQDKKLK